MNVRSPRASRRVLSAATPVRRFVVVALQVAALMSVALALLGVRPLASHGVDRILVLVDRSASVPKAVSDAALARVVRDARSDGHRREVSVLEFAGRPGAVASSETKHVAAGLQPDATNLEAALNAALAQHARTPFERAIVISDGRENAGNAERALRAARDAGLPLHWISVAREPPETHIASIGAPAHAALGQTMEVSVHLAGRVERPLTVTGFARAPDGRREQANGELQRDGSYTLAFDAQQQGVWVVDVAIVDPASGETLDARPDAIAVDVAPRAPILYINGSSAIVADSLAAGRWRLDVVPASRLDAYTDGLASYQAVVLDDVAVEDAGPRFWRTLVAQVQGRGLGLLVLGGPRSFDRGGYRSSELESVLPVTAEPAALSQPLRVVFAVDKSGSMGEGTAGVNRFSLAQQAVVETVRRLSPRDSAAVVLFDVEPHVLLPMRRAPAAADALARDWRASPRGGTRLAPAIATAIDQLEASEPGRRVLVVVTDGFVDDGSLSELRARAEHDGIETIAFAVGPDADVAALERLVAPETRAVFRVSEAAELPLVMPATIERRRARIERGTIASRQDRPLPFPPATFPDWPAVDAYVVARARAQATVAVRSERGDPLVAFWQAGQGRVIALMCGLGNWTPGWIRWSGWAPLVGGLAQWVSSAGEANSAIAVSESPDQLTIDADVRASGGWAAPDPTLLTVSTPRGEQRVAPAEYIAPGRWRAVVPDDGPGIYAFALSNAHGSARLVYRRSRRAEADGWGVNPAVDIWRKAGLIDNANPAVASVNIDRARAEPDPWLVALALTLFVAGVLVERFRRLAAMRSGIGTEYPARLRGLASLIRRACRLPIRMHTAIRRRAVRAKDSDVSTSIQT